MVKKTGLLMLAVAAIGVTLASASDAEAFFGRRGGNGGSFGSHGGSAGCYGGNGSYGSNGSFGSNGGRFRHRNNNGSCGSYGGRGSYRETNNCDACGRTNNACDCDGAASGSVRYEDERQASDRERRGERYEAGYRGETRVESDRPMAAPTYRERRGDYDRQADRQARGRIDESRESRQLSESAEMREDSDRESRDESRDDEDRREASERSDDASERDQTRESEKSESDSDESSDQNRQD
jgi:hypothetical protein